MAHEQANKDRLMDAPPPWKQAWAVDESEEKGAAGEEADSNSIEGSDDENIKSKNELKHEDKRTGVENEVPATVEILKAELNRDIDKSGLPSYEASMKLEPAGYF